MLGLREPKSHRRCGRLCAGHAGRQGVLIASLSRFVILLRLLGDLSAHASYGIILMIGRVYTSDLPGRRNAINESCTLYGARRFVIECPAPSTIFLAMKNSIIFISALSLVAMMLASCTSAFAPDETATTGVTSQTNQTPPERSAEDSVNSISGGHY